MRGDIWGDIWGRYGEIWGGASLQVSCLEVYNEEVRDLLAPPPKGAEPRRARAAGKSPPPRCSRAFLSSAGGEPAKLKLQDLAGVVCVQGETAEPRPLDGLRTC